ncbi:MAG: response regulator [Campylobacterota bacterium]|nr:response regulator [Campylobacterota bacterium]
MNLLIAEDTQETREVLRNIITYSIDDTIQIFESENGSEALDIIKNSDIDILLTDIMMPSMDGFELIKRVKESDATKHIFIAAITGLSGEEQVKKVFSCGADYYISKPIQQEDIIARLKLIYKLVKKEEHNTPELIRDTFNPFETPAMKNYYTIFTILQEDDLYQIIHYIIALYPQSNKMLLKDFITLLLKSYEAINSDMDVAFEIMLESSFDDTYLSCTNIPFIEALKSYEQSLSQSYEIKYMRNSMTIKIPTKG